MKKQQQSRIKVGIIGEHPNNDALALLYLLRSVASEQVEFVVMQKNNRGSQLDSMKFFRTLRAEFNAENPQHIIIVRDLDGLLSETIKVAQLDKWFEKANKEIQRCGIFYLAIYEMEALILSDVENLNQYFNLNLTSIGDPIYIEKPKEVLQKMTEKTQKGKYTENSAPKIFQTLVFKNVYKHHKGERSFQVFADKLADKKLISGFMTTH